METPNETGETIDARARVVARARSYLGPNGEPHDADPDWFWAVVNPALKGHAHDVSWCGGFALACLVLEGLWPADAERWRVGSGFVLRGVSDGLLRVVSIPEPGDVAVFGAPLWHHAIVERVEAGVLHTIDGNSIPAPREGVSAKTHPLDHRVTCYSIAPLIS